MPGFGFSDRCTVLVSLGELVYNLFPLPASDLARLMAATARDWPANLCLSNSVTLLRRIACLLYEFALRQVRPVICISAAPGQPFSIICLPAEKRGPSF